MAEAAGIEDPGLFLSAGFVRVRGKGNKEWLVPFGECTARVIHTWIEARDEEPVDLVGPGKSKAFELGREGVMSMVERTSADLGLRLHSHLLRHTCATTLLRSGMDLATHQRVLGHSSIVITRAYLYLKDEDIKAKHAATSPIELCAPTPLPTAKRRLLRPNARGSDEKET
ncbi:MAG: tyrosine-type recombinase/integrase [Chloroflexota bacterium]|nr:tyrosine-type recombinase/integrase [Chloroflexota bacterium]